MKILVIGGTRFVGKSFVQNLVSKGLEPTLFTRGYNPIPDGVEHLAGDRKSNTDLEILTGRKFDVIVDISGRTLEDSQRVLHYTGIPTNRFIYVSSAGVYKKSDTVPINEDYSLDPNSRHKGKSDTEQWLIKEQIPYTIFRPTYIYGPGNYNPIEKWFFDRIVNGRPVPVPANGETITQLGHVSDLSEAMYLALMNKMSINKIYNCSSQNAITFNGLIGSCAEAVGVSLSDIKLLRYNPDSLDSKARKIFPLRNEHFFTDISLIQSELNWHPKFDIKTGLLDSFNNDYIHNTEAKPDFSLDETLTHL